MTADQTLSERIHALIYAAISMESDIEMAAERERLTQAIVDKLRAGNIEFRLGPLALLAQAVETAADRHAARASGAPVCEHGYQLSERSIEAGIPVHMATGKLCGAPDTPVVATSEAASRADQLAAEEDR